MKAEIKPPQGSLAQRVVSLRVHRTGSNPSVARFVEEDKYRIGTRVFHRLRILLRSNGCSIPTCTMCPLPNEALSRREHEVSHEEYLSQMHAALAGKTPDLVCVYNDGSFFAERELDGRTRREIVRIVRFAGARMLMVESLPQFVTSDALRDTMEVLDGVRLVVGIGVQSSNDEVRRVCIASPVRQDDLDQVFARLEASGAGAKAYVLLKPPFLTEREGVEDAIRSCEWLAERHVEDITVCPTRVAPRTVAWELYKRGLYRPPQLTSLAIVLHTLQKRGIRVRASMFNVSSSDFAAVVPEICSECGDRTRIAIEAHCLAPGEVDLDTLCGACQEGHERADADVRELSERVEQYWQCLKHEQCGAKLYAEASGIP